MLCNLRWESEKNVVYLKCGYLHEAYFISTRKQWRCKNCKHTFSVTSGTIFANHKLPIQTYLFAIALFVNAVEGYSTLQLARDLDVQYKTAFVLAYKLRHSIIEQRNLFPLVNETHIDGTYIHTAPRPKNKKTERVDRRLKVNDNPNKRSVIVARERYSKEEMASNPTLKGAKITRIFTALSEITSAVRKIANEHIQFGTRIHADESPAYDEW